MPAIASAIPVKRGLWQTITLSSGETVSAQLCGDEHNHWWQDSDGNRYVQDSATEFFVLATDTQTASAKRKAAKAHAKTAQKRKANADKAIFQGEKRGLIILVQFSDMSFKYSNAKALYDRIANEEGYSDHDFNGSIRDYFIAQSGGQFTLDFDVAGPVTMSKSYSYYGKNVGIDDAHPDEMVKAACEAVDGDVDFSKYDWDGDGEVEEVFVVYAGLGEADGGSTNTIWPHMFWLSETNMALTLDGVKIDTYACTSELNGSNDLAGIGTFCHEFSHCMGFPDMYDTGDDGNFGMDEWDLMDYGSYNGDGYTPAGYSGYEKMVCGWTEPVELVGDTTISNIKPLSEQGQTYIVYNQGNKNEYYILENRQQKAYDAELPGHGMLIEHIDYDEKIWDNNVVNTTDDSSCPNSHQRITIFHANNSESTSSSAYAAYPYNGNDSLTNTSRPAAKLYNANSDGSYYMNCAIRNITENSDGTMSFSFGKTASETTGSDSTTLRGDTLFIETFDKCSGKGGNDGQFSNFTTPSTSTFSPDNDGWTGNYNSGGWQCGVFGTSKIAGWTKTPSFTLAGDTAVVSFQAACWNASKDNTSLQVELEADNAKLLDTNTITMTKGKFISYTLKIVGSGTAKISFTGGRRFFLDDIVVTKQATPTAIKSVMATSQKTDRRIYSLNGQFVGTDIKSLPQGIYIQNKKKIVKQ